MTEMGEEQKTIAKGAFWGLAGNMALKFVSLIYAIIIARLFTQAEIGVFSLALSIIYLLVVFNDLGMNAAFTRYVPFYLAKGEKEKAYKLLVSSYVFSGILSVLLTILVIFFAGDIAKSFQEPSLAPSIQAIALFLVLGASFGLNTAFLSGLKKIKELNLLNNAQNILKLVLTLALFFMMGGQAVVMAIAFTASYLFSAVVSFWYLVRNMKENKILGPIPPISEQIDLIKEAAPFGLTLALISGISNIAFYVDRIMMGYLLPQDIAVAHIGVYSMAVSMAMIILIFPGAVTAIFTPVAAELYGKDNKDGMGGVSKTAVRWNVFLLVPITITMLVFAKEILQMFYGSSYGIGSGVLAIFSVGIFIRMLGNVQGTVLTSMRVVRAELYAAVAAVVVNIVLNLVLIPIYGMDGAAFASLVSLSIATLIVWYFCRKIAGFLFLRETIKPIFAGLLALLLLLLIKPAATGMIDGVQVPPVFDDALVTIIIAKMVKLILLGIFFLFACISYFIFLLLLKGFRGEDWGVMFAVMKRAGVPEKHIKMFEGRFNP